jgi:membrane-associated phospholipid phosphatase
LFLIGVALLYLLAWAPAVHEAYSRQRLSGIVGWLQRRPAFSAWLQQVRSRLGFLVVACLSTAVYLIHPLKWILGRARPKEVFRGEAQYTEWYEVGHHFLVEGYYRGSFPSGHTATTFTYMAVAYVLIGTATQVRDRRLGWALGVFGFALSTMMLLARCMSAAHWVTDSVFSMFAGWATIHVLYHWFMPWLPEEAPFYRHAQRRPLLYELQIGFLLFLCALGLWAVGVGLRALLQYQALDWGSALVPGLLLLWLGIRWLLKLYRLANASPKNQSA